MKRINLTIILVVSQMLLSAQFYTSCLPDGIEFSSQAEIDNFQTNYPNCTEIEGDVTISGADITNLNGLSVVTSIGWGLSIGYWNINNPNLTITQHN